MKNKQSISSSIGIKIKAPVGFSVSSDEEVIPEKKKMIRASTGEEKFIAQLTSYIQFLEEQLEFVKNILDEAQKRNGCGKCGK